MGGYCVVNRGHTHGRVLDRQGNSEVLPGPTPRASQRLPMPARADPAEVGWTAELLRHHGHQFVADGLELVGVDRAALFGKADQQRQVAQPVDLPGDAVGESVEHGQ